MTQIAIDPGLCTGCGACVELCTGNVFERTTEGVAAARVADCWLCGHCVAVCPVDAIRHNAYPLQECPKLDHATVPSLDALVAALRERRSTRVFRDQPVPREVVQQLVDVGRWAPSASNGQPVDWLAFDDPQRIAALSVQALAVLVHAAWPASNAITRFGARILVGRTKWARLLDSASSVQRLAQRQARGQDPIFWRAPVVLIAHVPQRSPLGRDDVVYAVSNVMLAAGRLGLGTCQIGYFTVALSRSRGLRRTLGMPENRRAQVALILGYPKYPFHRALFRRPPNLTWDAAAT
jgi:nitroreductase/NAD-dependent dihydropyrimidine dehydrogenase PreA subunit